MEDVILNSILTSLLSFGEAIIIPIPPDVLLIAYSYTDPKNWWLYSSLATLFSILGGITGYKIGERMHKSIRKMVGENNVKRVMSLYEKYGNYGVFIAGFSPIPYKVFTLSSGILKYSLKEFIIYSIASRALRFYSVSYLTSVYGKEIVESYLNDPAFAIATIVIALLLSFAISNVVRYLNNNRH